jgi:hypothetical protein
MLFVLEAGGGLVGVDGLGWDEDRGDLRRTAEESRFEKKDRKAGMSERSRVDAVVGEDGVWPGHLLKGRKRTDAQAHADQQRGRAGAGRSSTRLLYLRGTLTTAYIASNGYTPAVQYPCAQIEDALAQPRRISSLHPGTAADGTPRFIDHDIFSHVD